METNVSLDVSSDLMDLICIATSWHQIPSWPSITNKRFGLLLKDSKWKVYRRNIIIYISHVGQ